MSDELNEVVNPEVIDDSNDAALIDGESGAVIEDQGGTAPEAAPAKELDGYEKRIARLTAHRRSLEEENEQLKQQLSQKNPPAVDVEPVIPDLPDPDLQYDDPKKYRELIAARDKAVIDYATWQTRQSIQRDAEARERSQREQQQQQQRAQIIDAFIENGLKTGISEDRMAANEQVLKSHGIKPDLAHFIYADANGAQLADYLAANPEVLREVNSLHPTQAAVKIATEIKPRALAKKPHVTNAPDPVSPTRGAGRPLADELDKATPGWSFEIS